MHDCLLRYELQEKDILNLYDDDISDKQFSDAINSVSKELRAAKKSSPQEKHLLFVFFASHGILRDGTQWIVLNEYDKKKEYYKLFGAELKMRSWAEIYPSTYIISIFACCR